MAIINHLFLNVFILLFFLSNFALSLNHVAQSINKQNQIKTLRDDENSCVYTIYVRTSTTWKAGTDSIISAAFYDENGDGILINDLEAWGGVMGEGHDYYERGNLDVFTGRGPCLDEPVCSMKLMSDGTGEGHGWYCNYVEVTTTGPHIKCAQQLFTVEQWIALDRSPHELFAIRNNCEEDNRLANGRAKRFSRDLLLRNS